MKRWLLTSHMKFKVEWAQAVLDLNLARERDMAFCRPTDPVNNGS